MTMGKVRRWAERLSDGQILALVQELQATLRREGPNGAALRQILIKFVNHHPSTTGPLRRATDEGPQR